MRKVVCTEIENEKKYHAEVLQEGTPVKEADKCKTMENEGNEQKVNIAMSQDAKKMAEETKKSPPKAKIHMEKIQTS